MKKDTAGNQIPVTQTDEWKKNKKKVAQICLKHLGTPKKIEAFCADMNEAGFTLNILPPVTTKPLISEEEIEAEAEKVYPDEKEQLGCIGQSTRRRYRKAWIEGAKWLLSRLSLEKEADLAPGSTALSEPVASHSCAVGNAIRHALALLMEIDLYLSEETREWGKVTYLNSIGANSILHKKVKAVKVMLTIGQGVQGSDTTKSNQGTEPLSHNISEKEDIAPGRSNEDLGASDNATSNSSGDAPVNRINTDEQ